MYKKIMAPIETPYPMDIIRVSDLMMEDLDMDDDGDLDSDDQAYLYLLTHGILQPYEISKV